MRPSSTVHSVHREQKWTRWLSSPSQSLKALPWLKPTSPNPCQSNSAKCNHKGRLQVASIRISVHARQPLHEYECLPSGTDHGRACNNVGAHALLLHASKQPQASEDNPSVKTKSKQKLISLVVCWSLTVTTFCIRCAVDLQRETSKGCCRIMPLKRRKRYAGNLLTTYAFCFA